MLLFSPDLMHRCNQFSIHRRSYLVTSEMDFYVYRKRNSQIVCCERKNKSIFKRDFHQQRQQHQPHHLNESEWLENPFYFAKAKSITEYSMDGWMNGEWVLGIRYTGNT